MVFDHQGKHLKIDLVAAANDSRDPSDSAVEMLLELQQWRKDCLFLLLLQTVAQNLHSLDQLLGIFAIDGDAAALELESVILDGRLNGAVLGRGDLQHI